LRKLLVVLLLIVGSAGAALALIPYLVSDETIRQSISSQLSSVSGSRVVLGGDVNFTVFPNIGFSADNVSIGEQGDDVVITTQRMVAAANLLALFSGQVNVNEIRLEKPDISLRQTAEDQVSQSDNNTITQEPADIFQTVAGYLEDVSIDDLTIINGTVRQIAGTNNRLIASNLNLSLSAPGLDAPLSVAFDGLIQDQKIILNGELDSLAELLKREATPVELDVSVSPAPHPLLAEISVNGNVQLQLDGSYRLQKAKVSVADQPVNLNMEYTPGDRPHLWTKIVAKKLSFETLNVSGSKTTSVESDVENGAIDYAFTQDIDLNFELQADTVQTGNATAEGVDARISLHNGQLNGIVSSKAVAKGKLRTEFSVTFQDNIPKFWGRLIANSIDVASFSNLAAVSLPIGGNASSNLQFAFKGDTPKTISDTINLKGEFGLEQGTALIPELKSSLGTGAENISAISATAIVQDIRQPVNLSGNLKWRDESIQFNTVLSLRDLILGRDASTKLELKSGRVAANFAGALNSAGSIGGNLKMDVPSVKRFVNWIGVGSDIAIDRLNYSGEISASSNSFAVKNANIIADDSSFTGSASARLGNKIIVDADLSTDFLNIDKFTGSGSKKTQGGSGSQATDGKIDLSAFRDLNGKIRFAAKRIKYGDIKTGAMKTVIVLKDGNATIEVPEAQFYGGFLAANLSINANASPAITAKINLKNLDALPLSKDASGFDKIEGRLNSLINVKASGNTTDAMKRSLSGRADVRLADGAIRGVDVAKLLQNIQTVLVSGYKNDPNSKTEFTEFATVFDIQQGVATSKDLRLLSPLLRMDGSGNIDIANQTIDMRLNPRVVGSLTGQGGDFDATGLKMPLIVNGPLSKPKVYPDLAAILQDPQSTLKALSNLKGGIGDIGKDLSDPKALLKKQLEKIGGENGSDIIGGVLQNLGNSGSGNNGTKTVPKDGKELIGSLLQGALGNNQPAAGQVDQSNNNLVAPVQGEQVNVAIPVRSPRKSGGVSNQVKVKEAVPDAAKQVLDKVVPKELKGNTGDLLQGVFEKLTN